MSKIRQKLIGVLVAGLCSGGSVGLAIENPPQAASRPEIRSHPKIEGRLLQQLENARRAKSSAEEKVQVVLTLEHVDEAIRTAIQALGCEIQLQWKNRLQLLSPLSAVESLVELPGVKRARSPYQPRPKAITEGDAAIGADQLRLLGTDGSGVNVAVLDVGFKGYQDLLGSELPASVQVQDFSTLGFESISHGTAVAEIIHDIAPGAALTLVAFNTDLEYFTALDWLRGQDIHIVSASIGFDNVGPLDGTNEFAAQANRLLDEAGILYINAAGNEQDNYLTQTFFDPDGDNRHNFSGGDETLAVKLGFLQEAFFVLNWDDWGPDPANPRSRYNYDLYIWCPGTTIFKRQTACARSVDPQEGQPDQPPLESAVVTGRSGTYNVGIFRLTTGGPNHLLRLFVGTEQGGSLPMEYQTPEGSLTLPADGVSVFSVAAANVDTGQLEPFSSLGPTWDGRIKPDITGPDGVTTLSFGRQQFFGTSASVPHVTGAAALLKSQDPRRTAHELRYLLQTGSVDVGTAGKDNQYGSGQLTVEKFSTDQASSVYSGIWWNPTQSGHGQFIEVRNNTVMAAWYVYDRNGAPYWLLTAGPMSSATTYSGTVLSFRGPVLHSPIGTLFDSAGSTVSSASIGTWDITFTGPTTGTSDINLSGDDVIAPNDFSLTIERLVVYPAAEESIQLPYSGRYSGIWWNAAQSGYGVAIEVQGDQLLLGWYVYDDVLGLPIWVLSAGPMDGTSRYTGMAQLYTGPPIAAGADLGTLFNAAGTTVSMTNAGTVTLDFTSESTAMMTIDNVLSVNETIALERFVF